MSKPLFRWRALISTQPSSRRKPNWSTAPKRSRSRPVAEDLRRPAKNAKSPTSRNRQVAPGRPREASSIRSQRGCFAKGLTGYCDFDAQDKRSRSTPLRTPDAAASCLESPPQRTRCSRCPHRGIHLRPQRRQDVLVSTSTDLESAWVLRTAWRYTGAPARLSSWEKEPVGSTALYGELGATTLSAWFSAAVRIGFSESWLWHPEQVRKRMVSR